MVANQLFKQKVQEPRTDPIQRRPRFSGEGSSSSRGLPARVAELCLCAARLDELCEDGGQLRCSAADFCQRAGARTAAGVGALGSLDRQAGGLSAGLCGGARRAIGRATLECCLSDGGRGVRARTCNRCHTCNLSGIGIGEPLERL